MIENFIYGGVKVIGGIDDVSYPEAISDGSIITIDLNQATLSSSETMKSESGTSRLYLCSANGTNSQLSAFGPCLRTNRQYTKTTNTYSNESLSGYKYHISSATFTLPASAVSYSGMGTESFIALLDITIERYQPVDGNGKITSLTALSANLLLAIKVTNGAIEKMRRIDAIPDICSYQIASDLMDAASSTITYDLDGLIANDKYTTYYASRNSTKNLKPATPPSIEILSFYPDPTPN